MGIGVSTALCSMLKIYSYSNPASSSKGGDDNTHLSSKSTPLRSTDKPSGLLLLILCILGMLFPPPLLKKQNKLQSSFTDCISGLLYFGDCF